MKKLLLITGLLFISIYLFASVNPDDILGVWKNGSGKGYIQIFKQQGKFYGKITWLKNAKDVNGNQRVDRRNEDPAKRTQPLIGLIMLHDFKYADGEWTDGHIYNPSDGKEYKGNIKLQDNDTLVVRGYVGLPIIGKSDTWTRVK